ncbi:ADP-ribosyl cyclase/cyclic ADP-ribose hydrolase 1-like [Corticium candelabrum]|uniref:ADP-ribosyl cyclase/cyclic ADP-ribose hydrolase 1-like n=1 Tax=Corticium candelabrum TaxID=121492 RepID=UPI002E26516C|nr:ADP-ribosyl cyclase/cyclic ADP-ribose hydrolase 1-like [Corticium candelabrum]
MSVALLSAFIAALIVLCPVHVGGVGTTLGIENIVKGRCAYYRQSRLPAEAGEDFALTSLRNLDCDKVWDAFKGAFAHRNPCKVVTEDYSAYYNLTETEIPAGKELNGKSLPSIVQEFWGIWFDVLID